MAAIDTLIPSPTGELTHNDVRVKINEVITAFNALQKQEQIISMVGCEGNTITTFINSDNTYEEVIATWGEVASTADFDVNTDNNAMYIEYTGADTQQLEYMSLNVGALQDAGGGGQPSEYICEVRRARAGDHFNYQHISGLAAVGLDVGERSGYVNGFVRFPIILQTGDRFKIYVADIAAARDVIFATGSLTIEGFKEVLIATL